MTNQSELREQVSKVIDGWRYEQDWVASKAEDFPEHKGAGCGCPVCVKMSALNSQATNELMALITQYGDRREREGRIDELNNALLQIGHSALGRRNLHERLSDIATPTSRRKHLPRLEE